PTSAVTETYSLSLHDALPILNEKARLRFKILPRSMGLELAIPAISRSEGPSAACGIIWHRSGNASPHITYGTAACYCLTAEAPRDRKSTRLNSSHGSISSAVF